MRRRSHNHLILMSVLFWVLAASGVFSYVTQESAVSLLPEREAGQKVVQQCIESTFPVISRGVANREASAAVLAGNQEKGPKSSERAEGLSAMLQGMVDKTFPILSARISSEKDGQADGEGADATDRVDTAAQKAQENGQTAADVGKDITPPAAEDEPEKAAVPVLDTEESKKPLVLIYHTHATESYQPVSVGNFHSVPEEGTVRQVGNELAKALEAKGIPVIHDKTLHDNPSYNESYSRSIQTVKNYLAKNPSIKIVIDLHRDAASYSGNVGKTTTVKGNKAATYSLVVGKGNANVDKLYLFANRINAEAEKLYPGLAGRIIDKEYRFNQYVSDYCMLLEVGNNENTIDQVKLTGKYFADILEAYIKDYPID